MLPEGWTAKLSKEICEIVDCVNKTAHVVDEPTPFKMIRTTNVRNGRVDVTDARYVTEETFRIWTRRGQLKRGDTILTREAPVGEIGLLDTDEQVFLGQRTMMFRALEGECHSKFLYYSFLGKDIQKQIQDMGNGGTVEHVRVPDCGKFSVKLPPIAEQRRIAEILSTWDRAIAVQERLVANARAQKKALMQTLLTGKKRLPGFKGEWKTVAIKSMGSISSGGTPDSENEIYWNGHIPWTTPTDITALNSKRIADTKRKISAKGLENCSAKLLPIGSLLICTRATIGDMAIAAVPISTNQGFKNLTPNSSFVVEYLFHLFAFYKHIFVRYACGSTFLELSKFDFEKREFSVPQKPEQQAIANVLENADLEIESFEIELKALRKTKSALMQQLLTGKRRVKVEAKA